MAEDRQKIVIYNQLRPLSFGTAMALSAFFGANATPANATVVAQNANGFVSRVVIETKASPRAAWLKLISPADWWDSKHTWTGSAANLNLTPQTSGCFCETIPPVNDAKQIGLQGSAEHMRVIQAVPDKVLRMRGALGPLQSEAVNGVLTISILPTETGSQITAEYVVGGYMRFETAKISGAVDAVISNQIYRLGKELGLVEGVKANVAKPAKAEGGEGAVQGPPAKETPKPAVKPAAKQPDKAGAKVPVKPAEKAAPKPESKPAAKPTAATPAKPSAKPGAKPGPKPKPKPDTKAPAPKAAPAQDDQKRITVDEAFGKPSKDE